MRETRRRPDPEFRDGAICGAICAIPGVLVGAGSVSVFDDDGVHVLSGSGFFGGRLPFDGHALVA
jgi:hypothetical protein